MQRRFGRHRLEDVLFHLNRIVVAWGQDAAAADHIRASVGLQDLPPGQPLLHALAADCARFACAWSLATRALDLRECTQQVALDLLAAAWPLAQEELLVGGAERKALFDSVSNREDIRAGVTGAQRAAQRAQQYRYGHAAILYGEAAARRASRVPSFPYADMQGALRTLIGCDLSRFLGCVLQIEGKSRSAKPRLSVSKLLPVGDDRRVDEMVLAPAGEDGLLQVPVAGQVLRLLSGSPIQMEAWMREEVRGRVRDDRLWLEGPSPLRRFPLVIVHPDRQDHCIAPVPSLISDWLYEPLMDRLFHELRARLSLRAAGQVLGHLHEEHVGYLADLCSPGGGTWISEEEIAHSMPNDVRRPDWIREFDSAVVLLEAKRRHVMPTLVDRIPNPAYKAEAEETLVEALEKVAGFWAAVGRGKVHPLRGARDKQPVAVVVTHDDMDVLAGSREIVDRLQQQLGPDLPRVPTVVMSLHRYEVVMTAWYETGDPNWLPEKLLDAAQNGMKALSALNPGPTGPLWDRIDDLVRRLPGQDR